MKMNFIRTVALAGLITTSAFTTTVFAKETVSFSGSTSVTEPLEKIAETYQKANPNVVIEINGTGSSAGIKAVKAGNGMFGMSSRELKASEKTDNLKEVVIAHDGIAIVVNSKNKVRSLTKQQVADIFSGKITKWSEVGGVNKSIVVVTREPSSGTRGAFEELLSLTKKVGDKSLSTISQKAQVTVGNGVAKTTVSRNEFAIGYISLGSVDESLKAIDLDGVQATEDNVKAGSYKLSRPFLVLYLEGKPSKAGMDFITWVTGSEGQELVHKLGYIKIDE